MSDCKKERFSIFIDTATLDQLKAIADERRVSRSWLANEAIRAGLARV